jgi:hypothetical protein
MSPGSRYLNDLAAIFAKSVDNPDAANLLRIIACRIDIYERNETPEATRENVRQAERQAIADHLNRIK